MVVSSLPPSAVPQARWRPSGDGQKAVMAVRPLIGLGVHKDPRRALGPGLGDQYRLGLWRYLAQEEQGAVDQVRRAACGRGDGQFAHPLFMVVPSGMALMTASV